MNAPSGMLMAQWNALARRNALADLVDECPNWVGTTERFGTIAPMSVKDFMKELAPYAEQERKDMITELSSHLIETTTKSNMKAMRKTKPKAMRKEKKIKNKPKAMRKAPSKPK